MDKYRKVIKAREETEKPDEEIRVTAVGSVSAYVSRATVVLAPPTLEGGLDKDFVVIKATGNALTKAVTAAEVIKRRVKGLHQITKIGNLEVVDEYEPLEEGLDKVSETRQLPTLEITLSKVALDTSDKGYQAPIDESLVKEMDPEELVKNRGRGKGRGKGKGKGKDAGKGKGKGKGKEAESKGKGKGKGKGKDEPKGKGKGKGKGKDEPKGKGKGKGKDDAKGKGKGKDDSKGKGKGKDSKGKGKGKDSKGKGKSKSYNSYDDDWYGSSYGYNNSYDSYSKGSKGKGKGKSKGWSSW